MRSWLFDYHHMLLLRLLGLPLIVCLAIALTRMLRRPSPSRRHRKAHP
jgi:hypothetical protein